MATVTGSSGGEASSPTPRVKETRSTAAAADASSRPESAEATVAPSALAPKSAFTILSEISALQLATVALVVGVFFWAYAPSLAEMIHAWKTIDDYSHGYLVLPIALFVLFSRMDTCPVQGMKWNWWGLVLIGFASVLRIVGASFFIQYSDGWTIIPYVAGVCLLVGGFRFFLWALPAVLFLGFMVPLPFAVETAMKYPLQTVATKLSAWMLVFIGIPAYAEMHTIWLPLIGQPLQVEEACSGLRIFVSIAVLAIAYILVIRPPWWEVVVLCLSIVPVALVSNALRIVITGVAMVTTESDKAHKFWHDNAGLLMLGMAAAQFAIILWYMNRLYYEAKLETIATANNYTPPAARSGRNKERRSRSEDATGGAT